MTRFGDVDGFFGLMRHGALIWFLLLFHLICITWYILGGILHTDHDLIHYKGKLGTMLMHISCLSYSDVVKHNVCIWLSVSWQEQNFRFCEQIQFLQNTTKTFPSPSFRNTTHCMKTKYFSSVSLHPKMSTFTFLGHTF